MDTIVSSILVNWLVFAVVILVSLFAAGLGKRYGKTRLALAAACVAFLAAGVMVAVYVVIVLRGAHVYNLMLAALWTYFVCRSCQVIYRLRE